MRRRRGLLAGIVLLAVAVVPAGTATAEVYKWVDEQGNVHFGDKPRDRVTAEQAEQVDIVESYQPTERTAEEQGSIEEEQEALRRRHELYKKEDQQARLAAKERRRKEKTALCSNLKREITAYTRLDTSGGGRTYYYKTDEDGNSLTSKEQRAYVAGIRQRYSDAGCE